MQNNINIYIYIYIHTINGHSSPVLNFHAKQYQYIYIHTYISFAGQSTHPSFTQHLSGLCFGTNLPLLSSQKPKKIPLQGWFLGQNHCSARFNGFVVGNIYRKVMENCFWTPKSRIFPQSFPRKHFWEQYYTQPMTRFKSLWHYHLVI